MGMKTYGQVISYCVAMRECQDLTHCFALLVIDNRYVRAFRWDQAGIVVTERVDFHEEPEKLGKFLWLYNRLSDAERGIDSTIRPAKKAHKDAAWALLSEKYGAPPDTNDDLRQFKVYDDDSKRSRTYIAGRPRWSVRSPLGRGTRGFFAYGIAEKRLVYLKDTWRIDTPEFVKEGDTYRQLARRLRSNAAANDDGHNPGNTMGNGNKAGSDDDEEPDSEHGLDYEKDHGDMPLPDNEEKLDRKEKPLEEFLPTLLSAGDVTGQATVTQNLKDEWWCFRTKGLQRHQHYRLVLREIGRNLWEFKHIKEVCRVICDTIRGQSQSALFFYHES